MYSTTVINAQNINYIRGDSYIIKNINWSVEKGQHWAVLGLNGSGKTTLLNMINGYIFPSDGILEVLGKRFGQYDLRELRKSIGWVSTALQERLYGSETGTDIVLSGKFASIGLIDDVTPNDHEQAMSLLQKLSADYLNTQPYRTMSQGEKQKILIARALMASPRLLILDEPCTGLDFLAKETLLSSIEALSLIPDPPTIIYVTHRTEEILPLFKHTLLLKKGQVFDSGETRFMIEEKKLRDFFEVPVRIKTTNGRFTIEHGVD